MRRVSSPRRLRPPPARSCPGSSARTASITIYRRTIPRFAASISGFYRGSWAPRLTPCRACSAVAMPAVSGSHRRPEHQGAPPLAYNPPPRESTRPSGAAMAIDFTLTSAQQKLQRNAREFATEILQPLVKTADEEPDTQKAFQLLKGAYVECHKLGFAMGFLPKQYGGGGISNVDLQIVAEEITAVDPGFATVLLVNGLALMPVAWYGSEQQKRKWLGEATSDPRGEFIAGWTVSEGAGGTGGTANFDHPGEMPAGIGLTARHDRGRGEYVLNGTKHWPCNAGGWDLKGANVNICIVRTDAKRGGKSGLSAIMVPRGAEGVSYRQPISKLGHRLCQNNTIVFQNCR